MNPVLVALVSVLVGGLVLVVGHCRVEWRAAGLVPAVRLAGTNPAAHPPLRLGPTLSVAPVMVIIEIQRALSTRDGLPEAADADASRE
jgi:hypothetical protein